MRIPLTEPVAPRYIHINSVTNKVHLMVPVVGGQEISTDNTCKATMALREFFEGGALRELNAYKDALAFDIGLLGVGHAQGVGKEARLAQIEAYIEAVPAMRMSFGAAMTTFLAKPSNLYSIQLRPRDQDSLSVVVNPAFNVKRTNDTTGTPQSPLYNAMQSTFPTVVANDPRTRLTRAVLGAIPASASFADIQRGLGEQSLALFGVAINFTQCTDGTPATKEAIDTLMGFGSDATPEDYIQTLLGACARDVWATLPTPPFYSIPAVTPVHERTERLSIMTQFFLANLNVYCKAKGISAKNFGLILDASLDLSQGLVSLISATLASDGDIERAICNFCNTNADTFSLSRALHAEDLNAIRQTFERTYRTVTATAENPHMDDFMILDKEATGKTAQFVMHQGAICVNFAELIDPTAESSNPDYFACIRADFEAHPAEVPHRNESVGGGDVEVNVEILLARINDEQFERLPKSARHACFVILYQSHDFLYEVAKGRQEQAEVLLIENPANTQTLLRIPGLFTDYSGRRFNCTAYEYAYWAKDTHMCRMLNRKMDEDTKASMLERCRSIELNGLKYTQNGTEHCSKHFDLRPLKTALQAYTDAFSKNYFDSTNNWPVMHASLVAVRKAQRDVPAHVAQEYCRPDRSFYPTPEFDEVILPRDLVVYDSDTRGNDSWFSLASSESRFGIVRGVSNRAVEYLSIRELLKSNSGFRPLEDLAAITRLDEVRTADLTISRERLKPREVSHDSNPQLISHNMSLCNLV